MKITIILFLLFSLNLSAQRVEFNDPDLTFSFEKPSNWIVNDGPTVFVFPDDESLSDPITFFSITYFENPEQTEESEFVFDTNEIEPSIPSGLIEFNPSKIGRLYIADETALWASYYHTQGKIRVKAISYVFMKMNQRFEITVSAPLEKFMKSEPLFKEILSSLSINKN